MNQTIMRGSPPVFEIANGKAMPLVPIESAEQAASWYQQAAQSVTVGTKQELENLRQKASIRALVIGIASIGIGMALLWLAWFIAVGVAGLLVAGAGALGLVWLYFKGDTLIKKWRIDREVAAVKLAGIRERLILAAKQEALDALKAQAARNPIATRQLQAEAARTKIQGALALTATLNGKTDRLAVQLETFKAKFASRPQPEIEQQLKFNRDRHDSIVAAMNRASEDLDAFVAETLLIETSLQLAAAGRDLAEFLGASDAQEQREQVLRQFASSQALSNINTSISALEAAMSRDNVSGRF
jgi:DNA-binding protein YbaB